MYMFSNGWKLKLICSLAIGAGNNVQGQKWFFDNIIGKIHGFSIARSFEGSAYCSALSFQEEDVDAT